MDQPGSVLIVSFGPVPTAQHRTVEGGGMRAWGLALGLRDHGYQVTVGINVAFPLTIAEQDGISLVNWSEDAAFADLLNSFDTVIASYCMGGPSVFIDDRLETSVRLVLDLYVPIYVEVAARDSNDLDTEYTNFMADIERHNNVLTRGDYFLCANEPQKLFYTGILGSLGVINPHTYREHRLMVVPFGVERAAPVAKVNPYRGLGIGEDDFVLLWFGGLYPWFKIDSLLGSVAHLAGVKLVIVGGSNPFNTNADFQKQYEHAVQYCKENGLTNERVFFVDWVDYADRADWYRHADVVISLNTPGEENALSWRTRVIDYVWGELVMLSNGGDPLSDLLINADAAIRLDGITEADITAAVNETVGRNLDAARDNLVAVKQRFFWDVVVEPMLPHLASDARPYLNELERRGELAQPRVTGVAALTPPTSKVGKVVGKGRTAVRIARTKGVRASIDVAVEVARNQAIARSRKAVAPVRPLGRRYNFVSHPIDFTGAPLVLLDMVDDFADAFGAKSVQILAPTVEAGLQRRIARAGIRTTRSVFGFGDRFLSQQMPVEFGDFVLLNTVAVFDNYRDYVFRLLESGRLQRAYWYIHEDIEQLALVGTTLLTTSAREQVTRLANDDKLVILTPSQRVSKNFSELFGTTHVHTVPVRVEVDASLRDARPAEDFDTLRLLLSGNPLDGRKGQFLLLAALGYFEATYRAANPSQYRDVELTLVAVGDNYVARQIKAIGSSLLGDRFRAVASVPKDEAMAMSRAANVSVCCSINETFALYVAEGMLMGHVILRNDSAGREEQLRDGENGYLVTDDVKQFAAQIERLANRSTANETLAAMGRRSQELADPFTKGNYVDQLLAL
ncbi:MAG: glycosyltransferase [Acidimicrobiales bacterium]|nr:glycosyltransferase [Acidimicrobiales bacterium]